MCGSRTTDDGKGKDGLTASPDMTEALPVAATTVPPKSSVFVSIEDDGKNEDGLTASPAMSTIVLTPSSAEAPPATETPVLPTGSGFSSAVASPKNLTTEEAAKELCEDEPWEMPPKHPVYGPLEEELEEMFEDAPKELIQRAALCGNIDDAIETVKRELEGGAVG